MGTPDFAVASLKALYEANFDIVGVVTTADKPAGRGQKLTESAVKKYALEMGLPILQPLKLKDPEFLNALSNWNADLFVVVAFRMLPEQVWNMPAQGTINLHASLLPQYRGAAPINHAIINGEKETGVSTFFLQHEIDTGEIIRSARIAINPEETAGTLHDKLMDLGAKVLVETVNDIANGQVKSSPQPTDLDLKLAPKIFKEFCLIDWNRPAKDILQHIRGLSPYPAAYTHLEDKKLKVYQAEIKAFDQQEQIGHWKTDGKSYLYFAAQDAFISLLDVQYEGKKRMSIQDFLRGIRI